MKKYAEAIKDCEKCLEIEPDNMKALHRLSEAYSKCGMKEKALELSSKILEKSPNNTEASGSSQNYDKPPINATRIRIDESTTKSHVNQPAKVVKKQVKWEDTAASTSTKSVQLEYDLASVVRPKQIVSNKWTDAASNMIAKQSGAGICNNQKQIAAEPNIVGSSNGILPKKDTKICLPIFDESTTKKQDKPLIEEI